MGWLAVLCLVASWAAPAHANERWYSGLDRDVRNAIQDALVWSGDYRGRLDGAIGPNTRRAVRDYQARIGTQADGLLTSDEFERLLSEMQALQTRVDWRLGHDDTGLGFGLPYAHASVSENHGNGNTYASAAGDFRVRTFRIPNFDPDEASAFARSFNEDLPGWRETYARSTRDWVVVSGEDATEIFYMHALVREGELRGFYVWYAKRRAEDYERLAIAMANSLAWRRGAGAVVSVEPDAGSMPDVPRPQPQEIGSGSGFMLRSDGLLVTNAHVVDGCTGVRVRGFGRARVLHRDDALDLAVLALPGVRGAPVAPLADDEPRLAEPVYAFGFPLPGTLGTDIGFSAGNVSALSGMKGDPGQFRMTAAVQPGNSGGPLLDNSGRVVGIVTAKLNAVKVADTTGDIPQSMNFAVRTSVLRSWLDELGLAVAPAPRGTAAALTNIAARAQDYTHQVLCEDR